MTIEPQLVENIRVASRLMVRELGFMNQTLAATNYSPSVVHTLLEAERCGTITAAHLVQLGAVFRAACAEDPPSR